MIYDDDELGGGASPSGVASPPPSDEPPPIMRSSELNVDLSVRRAIKRRFSFSTLRRKSERRSTCDSACRSRWTPLVISSTRGPTSSMTRSLRFLTSRCRSSGRSARLTARGNCGVPGAGAPDDPDSDSLRCCSVRNLMSRPCMSAWTLREAAWARASRKFFQSSTTPQSEPSPTPRRARSERTASREKRTSSSEASCISAISASATATLASIAATSSSPAAAAMVPSASASTTSRTSHRMYVCLVAASAGLRMSTIATRWSSTLCEQTYLMASFVCCETSLRSSRYSTTPTSAISLADSGLTIVVTNRLEPESRMSEYIWRYRGSKMLSTCCDPGVYATGPSGNSGSTVVPAAPDGATSLPRFFVGSIASHRISGSGASSSSAAEPANSYPPLLALLSPPSPDDSPPGADARSPGVVLG
mmetsp:Transcript_21206/g.84506  ORF Transcript_21206/g.84506 Transcript_21206/m.84506 type:complete len:420 (+) Transcript_21206:786-2045(+)